jgi:RHS repeat-associated protein
MNLWDRHGSVRALTDTTGTVTDTYDYDAFGNLIHSTGATPNNYLFADEQFDPDLNLYPGGLSNYNANGQLSTDTYDANGNTTASTGTGYVYDFENRLVQAGAGISFVYDGDGNRVSKTVAGVTTNYLVDTFNPTGYAQVVTETVSGTGPQSYVYGLERISRFRDYRDSGGLLVHETVYYVYDGHGSVRALTDPTGAVTDTYDYDAFGNLIHFTGTTPNNYLFAGEQFDPDLNLYYNRARYLNVSTGRFWSMDTYEGRDGSPLSLHKYLYASGDPIGRIDHSGRVGLGEIAVVNNIMLTLNTNYLPLVSKIAHALIPPHSTAGKVLLAAEIAVAAVAVYNLANFAVRFVSNLRLTAAEIAEETAAADSLVATEDGESLVQAATQDEISISSSESWGKPGTLARHYGDHGADFGAVSEEEYATQASEFFQRSQSQKLPTKIDEDGVIRVYEPGSNTFGSYNSDGTTRTFFKPGRGPAYWNDQPGFAPPEP